MRHGHVMSLCEYSESLRRTRGEILSLSKICTHAKLFANLTTRFADSLPARKY